MANTRIKDISTAATTLNSDDFIAVDGSTAGTRKMAKADLITEVSTGVSGTYLEESNNLSDVASKDTSKLNLEVPDVGSSANEVSLNGQLGTMAFQDSSGVSVGQLEVTDKVDGSLGIDVTPTASKLEVSGTTNSSLMMTRTSSGIVSNLEDAAGYGSLLLYQAGGSAKVSIQGNGDSYFNGGSVGIGSAPGSYNSNANNLVVGTGSGNEGLSIASGASSEGGIYFANGTTGTDQYNGALLYRHNINRLDIFTDGAARWFVDSTGNLIAAAAGQGIDFGSVAEGSGTPVANGGLLDDYESGSLTATLTPSGSGTITVDSSTNTLRYVKVGNLVSVTGKIAVSAVSSPVGSYVYLNLPFTVGSATGNRTAGTVLISAAASNVNTYGVFVPNAGSTAYICSTDGTSLGAGTTGQDFSGNEELHINITYLSA